jgi:hypothetical protein
MDISIPCVHFLLLGGEVWLSASTPNCDAAVLGWNLAIPRPWQRVKKICKILECYFTCFLLGLIVVKHISGREKVHSSCGMNVPEILHTGKRHSTVIGGKNQRSYIH